MEDLNQRILKQREELVELEKVENSSMQIMLEKLRTMSRSERSIIVWQTELLHEKKLYRAADYATLATVILERRLCEEELERLETEMETSKGD